MARRPYHFVQLDVFTDRIFGGNPLAVFLNGEGLGDAAMQSIAREMNLSETSFVLPPDLAGAVAWVRIFTPAHELPFAGHPTVGTAHALLTEGRIRTNEKHFVLQENAGAVPIRFEGTPQTPGAIWFDHPDAHLQGVFEDRTACAAMLGLQTDDLLAQKPVQMGGCQVPFLYVPLRDRAAVDRAALDTSLFVRVFGSTQTKLTGIFVFAPDRTFENGELRVYSRMFAPLEGIAEDPATGSASGPLGLYLVEHGIATPAADVRIVSEQGTKMGRQSFIHVRVTQNGTATRHVAIGGSAVAVLRGTLTL